jgi:hypothetical protein
MKDMQDYQRFSEKQLSTFRKLLTDRLGREVSDAEVFEGANNLMNFFGALQGVATRLRIWNERLIMEPQGFALPLSSGGTYNCGICYAYISGEQGWYDQYGIKCRPCQNAIEKKVIPGSVCKDRESWYSVSNLNSKFGWHHTTIHKKVRSGELKARIIKSPKGANYYYVFLKGENPYIDQLH